MTAVSSRLARFLDENRRVVDEVAFFETLTHHLYLPMEYLEEVAAILARRIETLKGNGVKSVGINVLTTIGRGKRGVGPPAAASVSAYGWARRFGGQASLRMPERPAHAGIRSTQVRAHGGRSA